MSTRNISWGKGGRCVRMTIHQLHLPNVIKSGSLNLLEPSGPHLACYGTALPLPFTYMLECCLASGCLADWVTEVISGSISQKRDTCIQNQHKFFKMRDFMWYWYILVDAWHCSQQMTSLLPYARLCCRKKKLKNKIFSIIATRSKSMNWVQKNSSLLACTTPVSARNTSNI